MYDLVTYDRRQTTRLLNRLRLRLPGKPVEAAVLPTTEVIVLSREDSGYAVHLLGTSSLVPTALLTNNRPEQEAPLLIPVAALRLMQESANIRPATRKDLRASLATIQ